MNGQTAQIIERAVALGATGRGGDCGQFAVALNRVVFRSQATLIAGLNMFFAEHGRLVGHVALRVGLLYWDDGGLTTADDVESWGMLPPDDPHYANHAATLGATWTEELATDAALYQIDEADALQFGSDKLEKYEAIFREALR